MAPCDARAPPQGLPAQASVGGVAIGREKGVGIQSDLTVISFEAAWNSLNFFRKTSLLMHWWEDVVVKLRTAERGTFWVIPSLWPTKGGELRNASLGLAKLLKDAPVREKVPRPPRPVAKLKPSEDRQTTFLDV